MRAVFLVFGTIAMVYVRSTSVDITLYSAWWWAWIVATVVIAASAGWAMHDAYDDRKRRK